MPAKGKSKTTSKLKNPKTGLYTRREAGPGKFVEVVYPKFKPPNGMTPRQVQQAVDEVLGRDRKEK